MLAGALGSIPFAVSCLQNFRMGKYDTSSVGEAELRLIRDSRDICSKPAMDTEESEGHGSPDFAASRDLCQL